MKTQYSSASSKESDDQRCQRLSEDQWVSCLLIFLLQIYFHIWLYKCARQLFTECLLLKPNWQSTIISYFSKCSISWLCTTLSITLDITGRSETGLQFFPFSNMGLNLAVLKHSRNFEPNDMMTNCDINSANISAPSFSILQGISSRPQLCQG